MRKLHRVPPFGKAPLAWLEAASSIALQRHIDVLLPTQEQVTVLSAAISRLAVATVVPKEQVREIVREELAQAR